MTIVSDEALFESPPGVGDKNKGRGDPLASTRWPKTESRQDGDGNKDGQ